MFQIFYVRSLWPPSGEPTNITRIEDIKKLDELAEMLNEEMKRRGRLIDVTPEKPTDPAPQEVPSVGS